MALRSDLSSHHSAAKIIAGLAVTNFSSQSGIPILNPKYRR
jgi:hypothetical protein